MFPWHTEIHCVQDCAGAGDCIEQLEMPVVIHADAGDSVSLLHIETSERVRQLAYPFVVVFVSIAKRLVTISGHDFLMPEKFCCSSKICEQKQRIISHGAPSSFRAGSGGIRSWRPIEVSHFHVTRTTLVAKGERLSSESGFRYMEHQRARISHL